jgi:hypothetical protein
MKSVSQRLVPSDFSGRQRSRVVDPVDEFEGIGHNFPIVEWQLGGENRPILLPRVELESGRFRPATIL